MFKFPWRNGFAVGLVVGIGIAVVFLIKEEFFYHLAKCIRYAECQPYAGRYEGKELPDIWWFSAGEGHLVSASDTIAQWIMAFLSFAAVVLLWLTLGASRKTLRITQDMARDTREIGEAQVRAYLGVFVRDNRPISIDEIEVDKFAFGHIEFVNTGQSPARNVRIAIFCETRHWDSPIERPISIDDHTIIFSSAPVGVPIKAEFSSCDLVTQEFVTNVDSGMAEPLCVFGTIWYEDVFKVCRTIEFNYMLSSNSNEVFQLDSTRNQLDNPIWGQCPHHNNEN